MFMVLFIFFECCFVFSEKMFYAKLMMEEKRLDKTLFYQDTTKQGKPLKKGSYCEKGPNPFLVF